MAHKNGRLEPEVIVNYIDGFAYNKNKMEEAFKPGGILDKPPSKAAKDPFAPTIKRDDVDLIVHELELTRHQAEKALIENDGDINKALKALITP